MERLVILGSGESGVGAAILGRQRGYDVFVSDKGQIKETYKEELQRLDIPFEEGQHTNERIWNADVLVKSPGIPDQVEIVQQARRKGIPVISEIELASRYTRAQTIGITGSNGKTTTTHLTHHLMQAAGLDAALAGNVGISFARITAEQDPAWVVLELSSFQLDDIVTYRPDISILLNITPDHLDRYAYQMENYIRSKFRIAMNQTETDHLVLNAADPVIQQHTSWLSQRPVYHGIRPEQYASGDLILENGQRLSMEKCMLKGPHNRLNALCAATAASLAGASPEGIQKGLDTFVNAPHRLEPVATIEGVEYINDSKATNVDSVFWALKAMDKTVVLILGGQDKGNDYSPLDPLVREKVRAIVCMGLDNEKIVRHFSPFVKTVIETASVADAVEAGRSLAQPGDTVLLSPACASFDLFNNYEHRGNRFKEEVMRHAEKYQVEN